ncbi:MAG: Eco29kI family restriction endonuclease [Bacteroidales bacterium]|nr:Eco29kI family restriction endonuclease [Bacteroidales bacterium]
MEVRFDREKHVFHFDAFDEIMLDIIRFFNGTPVHLLPPPESFSGAGVYALYYTGGSSYYEYLRKTNRVGFVQPIYIGKAVPSGWRKARSKTPANELYSRLCDHYSSIEQARNLDVRDFSCRFMIFEHTTVDMIGMVEAALIRQFSPIWNSCVDGFGNHDPGSGRYGQAKSDWDVLHPGRKWAERLTGKPSTLADVERKAISYYETVE